MSGFELVAVIVFFLIGYWVVDYLWPKKKDKATPGADAGARRADKDGPTGG